jgi:hypothetical protein
MIRQFVTQTTRREQTSSWRPAIQEFAVLSQTGEVLLASEEQPD